MPKFQWFTGNVPLNESLSTKDIFIKRVIIVIDLKIIFTVFLLIWKRDRDRRVLERPHKNGRH